ncbi:hypothetical protein M513_12762 [Trichuris suis]|nr:hypothetical protein M513_12762 [Trichuris suis]
MMASERTLVGQMLIPLLDGSNYEVWKIKMRGLFMKEDLWSATIQPKPEKTDALMLPGSVPTAEHWAASRWL